jgi:hypothetical protein
MGKLFGFDFFAKRSTSAVGEFLAPLAAPLPFRFELGAFSKGIDNVHIDIVLSPKLVESARRLARVTLQASVHKYLPAKSKWAPPVSSREAEDFERVYAEMMDAALGAARKEDCQEPVQLAEFAAMKLLIALAGDELRRLREELKQERGFGRHYDSKAARIQDLLVRLAREAPLLHQRVAQRLFSHALKVETTTLRQRRKSLLGRSWEVPREMMFNPVLLLPSPWHEEQVMHNYAPFGTVCGRLQEFADINRVLTGLFAEHLPSWVQPPAADGADDPSARTASRLRVDQGDLPGFLDVDLLLSRALREEEYAEGRTTWLDEPSNLKRLLCVQEDEATDSLILEESVMVQELAQGEGELRAFRPHLLKEAQARLQALGLLDLALVARVAPQVYEQLGGQWPVRQVLEYLAGGISRREMARRLNPAKAGAEAEAAFKRLDAARVAVRRWDQTERDRQTADFLVSFARLRRDLKLAYRAYWAMDQIRLLDQPAHIELSRRNRTLYEFLLPEERQGDPEDIRGHVILKADLRGSSRITKELRNRGLNPATHFTLNFFTPVNGLLERFGAKKVFVEGDAVILSIYEYEQAPNDWLAVSRASGLARKILEVVDAQNAQNRKHGLPELELGLGIAWLDEPPSFLYDGDHEIVISAAINRADRLSSCAASLRQTRIGSVLPRGVEVAAPMNQGIMQKDSGDSLLRYNVNGIELDADAFIKLRKELALQRVEARFHQYSASSLFYVGRYPDRSGVMHWLVIREAPVRLWIGNDATIEELGGRLFYEVITDPEVTKSLMEKLVASGAVTRREDRPSMAE